MESVVQRLNFMVEHFQEIYNEWIVYESKFDHRYNSCHEDYLKFYSYGFCSVPQQCNQQ